MSYAVLLTKRADRDLEGCPRDLRERVEGVLEKLRDDPRLPGTKRLSGALAGAWRVRVGSYRVVYDIHDNRRHVVILRIGPRASIYR